MKMEKPVADKPKYVCAWCQERFDPWNEKFVNDAVLILMPKPDDPGVWRQVDTVDGLVLCSQTCFEIFGSDRLS